MRQKAVCRQYREHGPVTTRYRLSAIGYFHTSAPQARIASFSKKGRAIMADPVTIAAVITGLVGAYKAYTEYKAATAKATEKQEAAPEQSKEAKQGEAVAQPIKAAVARHGTAKDAKAVANFEDDPDTYREALQKVLTRLAEGNPAFAAQLQALAQQHGVAPGSVTGTVNVSDSAKVDQAAGVNTGTMTYNAGQKKEG
jgi:hypothetical protein